MNGRILLIFWPIVFLFCGLTSYAQKTPAFQQGYKGAYSGYCTGSSVIELPDRDFIIAGVSTPDGSAGSDDETYGQTIIVRTDSLGRIKWSYLYQGTSNVPADGLFFEY